MKKFRLIFDKNTEIDWLNEIAARGWNLKSFAFGLYSFEPCTPGEFVYEADLKDKGFYISPEYRSILESQQIELIPTGGFWFLVRRKKSLGPLQLYTDLDSRIAQYQRIGRMFKICALAELIMSLVEFWAYTETASFLVLFAAILLALLGAVLLQAIYGVNQQIAAMEERCDAQSPLLFNVWGLFMMACGFMIRDVIPHWVFFIVMISGFGFVLYGTFQTIRIRKQSAL